MAPRIRRRITSSRRDEIEKEQEILSNVIVRPFDVVANLPVSFNPPPNGAYDSVMKNPLTVRDSAILYRSLMKSRHVYVHTAPMFDLYWVKQSSYARKLVEQDRPLPKSLKEESSGEREPILGHEFSARDAMVKLCDASMSLGPHEFAIRLFIAKDDRSDKTPKHKETGSNLDSNNATSSLKDSKVTAEATSPSSKSQEAPSVNQCDKRTTETSTSSNSTDGKAEQSVNSSKKDADKGAAPTLAKPTQQLLPKPSEAPTTDANVRTPAPPPIKTVPSTPAPVNDPTNMQSIENTIMISNLNAIARADESLNRLMKIVALGKATPQQITTFQGYIKRAREMGPQPHHSYLFNKLNDNSKTLQYVGKEKKTKERKPKEKKDKVPRDQRLTAFQEKYYVGATILFEYVENSNTRFKLPLSAIMEVLTPKIELTSSVEPDGETRDILVSFLWIHNKREVEERAERLKNYQEKVKAQADKEALEKDKKLSCESNGAGGSNVQDTSEDADAKVPADDRPQGALDSDNNENITTSGAQDKIDDAVEIVTKETPSTGLNEAVVDPGTSPVVSRSTRSRHYSSGPKRKTPAKSSGSGGRKLERPNEPEPRFTSVSLTLHSIPLRFVPIFLNSVKPIEDVQQEMSQVLRTGSRMSHFYLWYQVDGRLDQKLADGIRQELISEEKKMVGITQAALDKPTAVQQAAKKRKLKENAESKAKRQRETDGRPDIETTSMSETRVNTTTQTMTENHPMSKTFPAPDLAPMTGTPPSNISLPQTSRGKEES